MPPLPTVWTVGHSTRSIDDLLGLLRAHGIGLVVDVRSYPGSRRFPQFGQRTLHASLEQAGVRYEHLPALGGRRRARKDSANTAWRNAAFRGYADYMETPEFEAGLERLLDLAAGMPTAIMCAEALWWRCHRGLVADALKARGMRVLHIAGVGEAEEHPYTSAATIVDGRLSYQAPK